MVKRMDNFFDERGSLGITINGFSGVELGNLWISQFL
jgi:hypothetical protein